MPNKIEATLEKSINLAFVILTSLIILTYFISLALGLNLLFFTSDGIEVSNSILDGIPAGFFIFFYFYIPTELTLGSFFLALILVYIICFFLAWKLRVSFHQEVKNAITKPIENASDNFLILMPTISSMLLLVVVAIQSVQEIQGIDTGFIEFPNAFEALYDLAYSPILEEVSYRISPLGFVLLIIVYSKTIGKGYLPPFTTCLLCFLHPDKAKEKAGIDTVNDKGLVRGISLPEWITLISICCIFGLNHYLMGGGWGIGKITSAFVAGLVFGLAYLKYGFHAPILLHWFFNFYTYSYELAAETYHGLFEILLELVIIAMIIIGSYGWLKLFVRFFSNFSSRTINLTGIKESRYILLPYLQTWTFIISKPLIRLIDFKRLSSDG